MMNEVQAHSSAAAVGRSGENERVETSAGRGSVNGLEREPGDRPGRSAFSTWLDLQIKIGVASGGLVGWIGATDRRVLASVPLQTLGASARHGTMLIWPSLPSGTSERLGRDHRSDLHPEAQ